MVQTNLNHLLIKKNKPDDVLRNLSNTNEKNLIWFMRHIIMYGLHEQSPRWTENWLNVQEQRVVICRAKCGCRPVFSSAAQESTLSPVLFNMFTSYVDDKVEHTLGKFADEIVPAEVANTPEGPQQAAEMRLQEPHGVQQGELQSPALQKEQPWAPACAVDCLVEKQLGRKGPGGPGGH